MNQQKYQQINEWLGAAQHVLILPDERLDGDSLGAALALYAYLDRSGKKVSVFVSESAPVKYQYLPNIEVCSEDLGIFEDASIDLVISVDSSSEQYVMGLKSRINDRVPLINFDHHVTNSGFGDLAMVNHEVVSTTEALYEFFKENNIKIYPEMATALLAGIYFDTTVFSNQATKDQSMQTASELILLGARVNDVVRHQHLNRGLGLMRIWGVALERLRKHPSLGIVTTWITEADLAEAKVDLEALDGLSNFLHGVIDEDTIIVLREQYGGVKASMRTVSGDVGALAKLLGGGGHQRAAGFELPGARIDQTGNIIFEK